MIINNMATLKKEIRNKLNIEDRDYTRMGMSEKDYIIQEIERLVKLTQLAGHPYRVIDGWIHAICGLQTGDTITGRSIFLAITRSVFFYLIIMVIILLVLK